MFPMSLCVFNKKVRAGEWLRTWGHSITTQMPETETCPRAHVLSKPCAHHTSVPEEAPEAPAGTEAPSWPAPGPAKALHGDTRSSHGVIWWEK